MAEDIEFVNGLIVKAPRENAPEFVKCAISIKVADLTKWLAGKSDDWVNIDVKESREGKWYAAVNTYKPKKENKPGANVPAQEYDASDDIPFN